MAASTIGVARAAGASRSSRPYVSRTSGLFGIRFEPVLRIDREVADAHDHRPRVERLAGGVRRAGLGAAPALGAGEAVQQVLPAEVGDGPQAERPALRLQVHRRQLAPRPELAEVDVEEAGGHVEVLAAREIAQEGGHEQDMRPPAGCEAGREEARIDAPQRHRQGVRHDRAGPVAGPGRFERHREELGQDETADQAQDDERAPGERQARADARPAGARPHSRPRGARRRPPRSGSPSGRSTAPRPAASPRSPGRGPR